MVTSSARRESTRFVDSSARISLVRCILAMICSFGGARAAHPVSLRLHRDIDTQSAMMPTLLDDVTVLGDDAAEIARCHTTAHDKRAGGGR